METGTFTPLPWGSSWRVLQHRGRPRSPSLRPLPVLNKASVINKTITVELRGSGTSSFILWRLLPANCTQTTEDRMAVLGERKTIVAGNNSAETKMEPNGTHDREEHLRKQRQMERERANLFKAANGACENPSPDNKGRL